ncbi:MAG: threonylcarbamoyl-AMP synthase [Oscillospiraceae bacterium]|jgi:tRNA threonylcarbamoyl adenosine modification protein (Sua5/YciO/YrdC/YwlC family)/dephospho-CoA kinase|nr:threonylcarbamoyl-AMP synthase [Oscillospiraceae bacterium]
METRDFTENLEQAALALKKGGLVAVPTETVYGLAANGLDEGTVARIFELKGRPETKPLSLMVSGAQAISTLCEEVPPQAYKLAARFWPGPLTIVLKAKEAVPELVRAGGGTVGLRCPRHEKTLEVLRLLSFPLACPSANPSGGESPVAIGQVLGYFDGKIDGYIDGGVCALALESTVLDMSAVPFRILRQGALSAEDISAELVAGLTIIGITGGTGCGKTTALELLRERGALVLDADEIYHELLRSSAALRAEIDARFPGILPEGSFDTKDLGKIVFSEPEALGDLNAIAHKFVCSEITRRLEEFALAGGSLAAVDAIALIESGAGALCRATIAITAPTETRIARLVARDAVSQEYARLRIDAQKPNDFFEENCDYAICNCSTAEKFREKFEAVVGQITNCR